MSNVKNKSIDILSRPDSKIIRSVVQMALKLLMRNDHQVKSLLNGIPNELTGLNKALNHDVNLSVILWVHNNYKDDRLLLQPTLNAKFKEFECGLQIQ